MQDKRNPLDCHTRAMMALTKGDVAYRAKDNTSAAEHYTSAIALATEPELMVSLLCRRAAAYLYLKRLKKCVDDCCTALAVDPNCFRAYVVRCLAHTYLSDFSAAAEDHTAAVSRCSGNVVLLERLEEVRVAMEVARAAAVFAASRGTGAAPMADWIGDFSLLGLDGVAGGSGNSAGDVGKRRREALQGLPKLIPIGEWMGPDVCEQLLDYTSLSSPTRP